MDMYPSWSGMGTRKRFSPIKCCATPGWRSISAQQSLELIGLHRCDGDQSRFLPAGLGEGEIVCSDSGAAPDLGECAVPDTAAENQLGLSGATGAFIARTRRQHQD